MHLIGSSKVGCRFFLYSQVDSQVWNGNTVIAGRLPHLSIKEPDNIFPPPKASRFLLVLQTRFYCFLNIFKTS
jgi:hypothetical protein